MAVNLFELLERFIIVFFFMKLTQAEKTGSKRIDFISL